MAIKTKTELKDEIAENKLTKDLMNNMVDSMLDVVDGPLDFTNEAVIQVDSDTKLTIDTNGDAVLSGDFTANNFPLSGTYTPTIDNITNITNSTPKQGQWMRVGNVVTCSGNFSATPTSTGAYLMTMTLPIPSALTDVSDCCGAVSTTITQYPASILGNVAGGSAYIQGTSLVSTLNDYYYTFTYEVK